MPKGACCQWLISSYGMATGIYSSDQNKVPTARVEKLLDSHAIVVP